MAMGASASLAQAAKRLVRGLITCEPTWFEQIGAFGDGKEHPATLPLSIAYAAVVSSDQAEQASEGSMWISSTAFHGLAPRQREMLDRALVMLRERTDHTPIAFRLLRPTFTLSELQQSYELLLGKRLHKASFRRALQASLLVEPIDEWRSEGRGRPAQLFRYAPQRQRHERRPVRFDLFAPEVAGRR